MMSLFRLDKEPKCRMQVLQEREVMYEQLQKITEKELRARLEVIKTYKTINYKTSYVVKKISVSKKNSRAIFERIIFFKLTPDDY